MSWKQMPDGPEKLEAFLRETAEREAAKRPTRTPGGPSRSRGARPLSLLLLALLLAAVAWILV